MACFGGKFENVSYLVPRDPSIRCWNDRVKLDAPRTKNLLQLGLEDMESPTLEDGHVSVHLRLKPTLAVGHPYSVTNRRTLQTEAPKDSIAYKNITNGVGKLCHKFTFSSILKEDATQQDVFRECVSEHIKQFLNGRNFLLFAYGTTNAGKTFTMQGTTKQPGMIPRALDFVFTSLQDRVDTSCSFAPYRSSELCHLSEEQARKELAHKKFILSLDLSRYQRHQDGSLLSVRSDPSLLSNETSSKQFENTTFREMQTQLCSEEAFRAGEERYMVWVSMVEIYNEHVYDLLELPDEKGGCTNLSYGEDESGNTYIKNLRQVNVGSGDEAYQMFEFGRANLHLAPTKLNHRSSRSHCICSITLARFLDQDGPHAILSKFSFCDLAGSERLKKTLNVGDRLAESKSINTSLLIFGNCLKIIKENQGTKAQRMVPYRESKLTRLFRAAVTGKEPFSLIVNVTTDPHLFDETINVLKFSAIAQQIVPQNVFVKPRRPVRTARSRFSQMVIKSQSSSRPVDWEQTTVVDESGVVSMVSNAAYEQLLELVDKLRQDNAKILMDKETIESKTRQELCNQFTLLMDRVREQNQNAQEEETTRLKDMFSRKEERIIAFYQNREDQYKRAKRKMRSESSGEDSEGDSERGAKLKREVETLRVENVSLREHVHSLTEQSSSLQLQLTRTQFELSEHKRLLQAEKKQTAAGLGGENALVKELQTQLQEAHNRVKELKTLLDEASCEHGADLDNIQSLNSEIEQLEQKFAGKVEELTDLTKNITELQYVVKQKSEALEKMETMMEEQKQLCLSIGPLQEENKQKEQSIEQLNKQVDRLQSEVGESNRQREQATEECRMLTDKVKTLESDNSELEQEIVILKDSCKKSAKRLAEVVELNGKQQLELSALRAELKRAQAATENSKTVDSFKEKTEQMRSELQACKSELQNFQLVKRTYEADLDNLKKKLDTAEYHSKMMKTLKDEAERRAVDMPRLQQQIELLTCELDNKAKELESVVENRQIIFNNVEKEQRKLKEENERLKKDVLFSHEVALGRMTPHKEDQAQIMKLKEKLRLREEEILQLKKQHHLEGRRHKKVDLTADKENSPMKQETSTPDRLAREVSKLSVQSSKCRKADKSVHPSVSRSAMSRAKKTKEGASEVVEENGRMCKKKLFVDNDYDNLEDLDSSIVEFQVNKPRLRPRK